MILGLPLTSLKFVAMDIEATGVAPGYDRIIEVAAARFTLDAGGHVRPGPVFSKLVNPARSIPELIVRMTGIDDAMVRDAPELPVVWAELEAFLAAPAEHTVLMAHNGRADLAFLVGDGERFGTRWHGPPMICTLEVSRAALPDAPRHRLAALVNWLGCAGDDAVFHRARPDALHTRNLFTRCVARSGARTLADLGVRGPVEVPAPEDFEVVIPEQLAPVQACIEASQRISIVYRGGSKGRHPRPMTPLSFYRSDGVLYLRAWCHLDDVAKSFRCDRIKRYRL